MYSGKGNLAKTFKDLGHEVMVSDRNKRWDFTNDQHQKEFLMLHQRIGPDFVWLAPPCTKWSPLQFLSVKDEAEAQMEVL